MDLWAVARYDLHLSLEEFEELTPGMFQALCKRRNVRIKYERFANAQTAAAVYNVNRHSEDTPLVRAFDFVMDRTQSDRREALLNAKRYAKKAIGNIPATATREKFLEVRLKAIEDLKASGYEDAEEIFDECWPSLKPKENECQK